MSNCDCELRHGSTELFNGIRIVCDWIALRCGFQCSPCGTMEQCEHSNANRNTKFKSRATEKPSKTSGNGQRRGAHSLSRMRRLALWHISRYAQSNTERFILFLFIFSILLLWMFDIPRSTDTHSHEHTRTRIVLDARLLLNINKLCGHTHTERERDRRQRLLINSSEQQTAYSTPSTANKL